MMENKELTEKDIQNMSDEEWRDLSPFLKKHCTDCAFLKGAMSWYCTNEDAKQMRGTSLPAICLCPFWKPNWNYIPKKYKTEEYGYVPPVEKVVRKIKSPTWRQRVINFFKGGSRLE